MATFSTFICENFVYQHSTLAREVMECMATFREQHLFTDVSIQVGHVTFPCHRVIIAAASPYFSAMFKHDEHAKFSSTVNLPNLPASAFGEFLDFMYTTKLTITSKNVVDILEVADFLQFREIVHSCADILQQQLAIFNAISILNLAEAHLCQALADSARKYILDNFFSIILDDDFLQVPFNTLLSLLSDKSIAITSEDCLFHSLCEWIKWKKDERFVYIDNLMKFVDLREINKARLEVLQEKYAFLSSSVVVQKYSECELEVDINNDSQLEPRLKRVIAIIPENIDKHQSKSNNILFYQPQHDKWESLTELPFSQTLELQRITLVDNCLFVTGGQVCDIPINRVMKYDVADDTWSTVAPMTHARCNHGATEALQLLYVFAGKVHIDTPNNTLEQYDPMLNQWTVLNAMNLGCADVSNTFSNGGAYNINIANCDLVHLTGMLYVIGGSQINSVKSRRTCRQYYSRHENIEIYDFDTKTWSYGHRLKHNLYMSTMNLNHGTCFTFHGMLLLINEDLKGRRMKLYNPITDQLWDFVHTQSQHRFGAYVLQNDALYAIGGMAGYDGIITSHDLVHCIQLDTEDKWTMLSPLPNPISHYTAVVVNKRN